MRPGEKTFECTVSVESITEKALRVRTITEGQGPHDGESLWIPLSQIADTSEICGESRVGESGSLEISEWIAKEKGLL
jgi:hypothetical protein